MTICLTTTAASTTAKPCIRDYSELVTTEVPQAIAALVPLPEFKRRLSEVVRQKPRFAEEAPIYYRAEVARRESFNAPHIR